MIILPAIDIKDGRCVRLYKGDFSTAHTVAADIFETVRSFKAAGAEYIHIVDLDGAKSSRPINGELIIKAAREAGIPVEVGGGIRDMEAADGYLQNGIAKIILGSAALKDPEFLKACIKKYGDRIAVGIDALEGKVSTEGWLSVSDADYIEFARTMQKAGIKNIIFTDISKDGTLEGPNIEQLRALKEAVDIDVTASGGIRDISHIRALIELGVYGAICGKSIYSGTLDLKEAVRLSKGE